MDVASNARARTWDGRFRKGPVPRDTSPAAQQRRAVKRWHGNARKWTLIVAIPRRNRRIVHHALDGGSVRVIALVMGLSKSHVHRILRAVLDWDGTRWCRGVSHASVSSTRTRKEPAGFDEGEGIEEAFEVCTVWEHSGEVWPHAMWGGRKHPWMCSTCGATFASLVVRPVWYEDLGEVYGRGAVRWTDWC